MCKLQTIAQIILHKTTIPSWIVAQYRFTARNEWRFNLVVKKHSHNTGELRIVNIAGGIQLFYGKMTTKKPEFAMKSLQ